MRRVRMSAAARDAPRLITVVVLPTPPFWFAIAITLPMLHNLNVRGIKVHGTAFHVEQLWQAVGQDWSIEPTRISDPVSGVRKLAYLNPAGIPALPDVIQTTRVSRL